MTDFDKVDPDVGAIPTGSTTSTSFGEREFADARLAKGRRLTRGVLLLGPISFDGRWSWMDAVQGRLLGTSVLIGQFT